MSLSRKGLPVLPVYLSSSVKMRESHERCKPLIHLDPRHKLTTQFVELLNVLEETTSGQNQWQAHSWKSTDIGYDWPSGKAYRKSLRGPVLKQCIPSI
jgi:hypothetical protein